MNWIFTGSHTLTESHSGFTIYLLSGSWSYPEEVIPAPAEGQTMSYLDQAQLLRAGLSFAEAISFTDNREELPQAA